MKSCTANGSSYALMAVKMPVAVTQEMIDSPEFIDAFAQGMSQSLSSQLGNTGTAKVVGQTEVTVDGKSAKQIDVQITSSSGTSSMAFVALIQDSKLYCLVASAPGSTKVDATEFISTLRRGEVKTPEFT